MRKILLSFLAALCCVAMQAETIFFDCGANGDNMWAEFNTGSGALFLVGTGPMANYNTTDDPAPWYEYKKQIKSIQMDSRSQYTSIGDYAFTGCYVESCDFPTTLTSIGDNAFSQCVFLTGSMTFPEGLTTIGMYAFDGCDKITSFYIPATLTSIGDRAFTNCYRVMSYSGSSSNPNYDFSDGVLYNKAKTTLIAYPATHSRTTYTIPQTVSSIKEVAFGNAKNLTSIVLPENLKTIGKNAFLNCSSLTEITIPANVTEIGDGGFSQCKGLTKITSEALTPPTAYNYTFSDVNENIPVHVPGGTVAEYKAATGWKRFKNFVGGWKCGDNLIAKLSEDGKTLTVEGTGDMWNYTGYNRAPWYENRAQITAISLPEGLTSVGDRAFYSLYKVPAITLPSTLQRIGIGAFYDCDAFTTVNIPAGVTEIGNSAFGSCEALTAFTAEAGNTAYCAEDGVLFTKNKKILIKYPESKTNGYYEVPSGVEELMYNAIFDNTKLQSIILPASLLAMGEYALKCPNIQQIKSHASLPPVAVENTFFSIDVTIPVYVPVGAKVRYEAATGWKNFINIIEDESLNIENIATPSDKARKYLINGQLFIATPDGKIFNAQGAEVK